ncbi:hypothetical protein, partial [Caballeronia arationis]|uniref:hypothetical protein n=1 Tax=Caballeronia arationis TaxID=1777142 RepID=UPI001F2306F9
MLGSDKHLVDGMLRVAVRKHSQMGSVLLIRRTCKIGFCSWTPRGVHQVALYFSNSGSCRRCEQGS